MHKNDKDFRNNREPKSKNEAQEQKGQAQKQNDKVQNQKRESTEKKKIRDMVSEISKSRVLLRILLLILGLGFSAIGALIYIYHWNIEGFFVNLEYEDKELAITLTPLLGLLALVVGMYFIARFIKFNATKTKENALYIPKLHSGHETEHINHMVKHTSLSHSRFFAALLMTIMIVINFLKFDFFLSGENHLGCWFSLGGPSLFIPTSAIPTLFAAGLFLYVIFSTAIMRFSASDNFVHIEEYRLFVPWMTEIPKDKIKAVRLTNRKTGAKYTWIVAMIIPIVWLYQDGFHFLLNPFAYGNGLVAGTYYVATATVLLVSLIILLFKHQHFLEILTDEKRYELWFSPPIATPSVIGQIEEIFEIPALAKELKRKKINTYKSDVGPNKNAETHSKRYSGDIRNLAIGVSFLTIALISNVHEGFYLGDPLRIIFYAYSLYLIVKGIKEDFFRKDLCLFNYEKGGQSLHWRNKFGAYNSGYSIRDIQEEEFSIDERVKKLNFFDILFASVASIFLGIDMGAVLIFPQGEILMSIQMTHFLLGILILGLIWFGLIHPQTTLNISSKGFNFEIQNPKLTERFFGKDLNLEEGNQKNSGGKNLNLAEVGTQSGLEKWKYIFKNQKEALLLRVLIPAILFLLGVLIPLI